MKILKQSTATVIQFGPFVSQTDAVTLETSLVSAIDHATTGIKISKAGGALAVRTAGFTASSYDDYGNYLVTLGTTDTGTLGRLRIQFTDATSNLPVWDDYTVVPATVYDALVTNALGTAGGLLQVGNNALTTFTAGLVIAQSTTNGSALVLTGNGSGSAILATGGNASGSTPAGHGIKTMGGTASIFGGGLAGNGLYVLGGSGAASSNGSGCGCIISGGGTTTAGGGIGIQIDSTGDADGMTISAPGAGNAVFFYSSTGCSFLIHGSTFGIHVEGGLEIDAGLTIDNGVLIDGGINADTGPAVFIHRPTGKPGIFISSTGYSGTHDDAILTDTDMVIGGDITAGGVALPTTADLTTAPANFDALVIDSSGGMTFDALDVTNAFTLHDGLIVGCTTTDRNAVTLTPNGTGHCIDAQATTGNCFNGVSVDGDAFNGNSTNGNAFHMRSVAGSAARLEAVNGIGLNVTSTDVDAVRFTGGTLGDGLHLAAGGGSNYGLHCGTFHVAGVAVFTGAVSMPAGLTADITGTIDTTTNLTNFPSGITTQLTAIQNYLEADEYTVTTTNPWSLVYIQAGTGAPGVGVALMTKRLFDVTGAAVTAVTTTIGRAIQ